MSGVESLLNTTSQKTNKWLPIPIDKYRSQILKVYRQLRNKVHLSAATSQSESDYNSFDWKVYLRAKILLFSILNDTSFGMPTQHPIFTKLLEVTKQQIKHYRDTYSITYRWMD